MPFDIGNILAGSFYEDNQAVLAVSEHRIVETYS
jgi:hypothetical protein